MSVPSNENLRIVCYWSTLFDLARKANEGDPEAVAKWQGYEALCLAADEVRL